MTIIGTSNRIILALILAAAALSAWAEGEDSKAENLAQTRAAIIAQGRQALLELENDMRQSDKPALTPLVRSESVARASGENKAASDDERG